MSLSSASASASAPMEEKKPAPFTLRPARFSELTPAARACSRAFDDDVLFGRLIHPHRKSYPADVDKYWYRRFVVYWWDRSHVFLVTTEPAVVGEGYQKGTKKQGGEVITGFAHWSRISPSWRENYRAGWGWGWWDPRRLLKPIWKVFMKLTAIFSPNRAASPEYEPIVEQSYDFLDHVWVGPRAECWNLECLAVDPDYQQRGQGRALVKWGLDQARKEGIACSVIAADGRERFYQRCGFDVGPVARSGEGEGNPLKDVAGGLLFIKEKEGLVLEDREFGPWMEGKGGFDWDEWMKKIESKKVGAVNV